MSETYHKDREILHEEKLSTSIVDLIVLSTQKGVFRVFLEPENEYYQAWLTTSEKRFRIVPAGLPSSASEQLLEYADGRRQNFDCPLDLRGTPFQLKVWRSLLTIPYGATKSYSWVSQKINKPGSSRAVGLANGQNPIPIIIPCHRVIGKNGNLTGFRGGVLLKKRLLDHEAINSRFFSG
ncbi:MAG: methylated-DNA--[protein]-cysteine S-methyltransferase [Candidatus Heimdallarchaeota archaeon]